jgi:CBS domain containing-hemolysin-like protein
VRNIVHDPNQVDQYVATAQLGITLASLGLGMYGEQAIAHLIEVPLHDWFGLEGTIVHTISFIISLTLITYLHVVVGEMVPKTLALQNPERMVLLLTAIMRFVKQIFGIPVKLLNQIGLLVLRLLRIPPPGSDRELYTPDELELIVTESAAGGLLEEQEQELVANIFDFAERRVGQVMTPRTMMKMIPVTISEEKLLQLITHTPHSRLPVYEGRIDNIIGVLHLKEFVRQQLMSEPFDLRALLWQVPFVPENLSAKTLLASFRNQHLHMAIVIDEHGGILGLVTLEDLVEEVVGEVQDEFDVEEEPPLELVEPGHLRVQGTVLLETLEPYIVLDTLGHDVETVGGLALAQLGRPPLEGDQITVGDATLEVEAVTGLAVKRVSLYFPVESV